MTWWNVYLNGRLIDSVTFDSDVDEWHVLNSLINHDGYNPNIIVRKVY